jgi:Na+-transporting methylmalonyl-CoA/oxaloacetate decarboxylase gamma subunit
MKLVKSIPLISIVALALTGLFNIGYFSKIGLHFLGIIDLSNVVYSFGLVFVFLIFLFPLVFTLSDFARWLFRALASVQPDEPADKQSDELAKEIEWTRRLGRLMWFVGAVFGVGIATAIHFRYLVEIFENEYIRALAFFIGLIFFGATFWSSRQGQSYFLEMLGESNTSYALLTGFFLVMFTYFLGRAVADYQMFSSPERYTISIKGHGQIEDARIVRSSSSGFILSVKGKMIFVPQSEIGKIEALE